PARPTPAGQEQKTSNSEAPPAAVGCLSQLPRTRPLGVGRQPFKGFRYPHPNQARLLNGFREKRLSRRRPGNFLPPAEVEQKAKRCQRPARRSLNRGPLSAAQSALVAMESGRGSPGFKSAFGRRRIDAGALRMPGGRSSSGEEDLQVPHRDRS